MVAERYCRLKREFIPIFVETFQENFETIHRLETNKLRNVGCCYAHMLFTDALPWTVFSIIRLTEADTTSSRWVTMQWNYKCYLFKVYHLYVYCSLSLEMKLKIFRFPSCSFSITFVILSKNCLNWARSNSKVYITLRRINCETTTITAL